MPSSSALVFSMTGREPLLATSRGADMFYLPYCVDINEAEMAVTRIWRTFVNGGMQDLGPGIEGGTAYAGQQPGSPYNPASNDPPYSAFSEHTAGRLIRNAAGKTFWVRATTQSSNFLGTSYTPRFRFFGNETPHRSYVDSPGWFASYNSNIGLYYISANSFSAGVATQFGGSGAECWFGTPAAGKTGSVAYPDSCLVFFNSFLSSGGWDASVPSITGAFEDGGAVNVCAVGSTGLIGAFVSGFVGLQFGAIGLPSVSGVRTQDNQPGLLAPMVYIADKYTNRSGRRGYCLDLIWQSCAGKFGEKTRILGHDCICLSNSPIGNPEAWSLYMILA